MKCPPAAPATKPCPTNGSTLLDDTYPVNTFVISMAPFQSRAGLRERAKKNVPKEFILKILESYKYSETSPNFVIPVDRASFEELQDELRQTIAASGGKIPEKILDKIVQAEPARNWTWQQDYFESFVDPATGRPVLRNIQNYYRGTSGQDSSLISTAMNSCGVTQGPELASSSFSSGNGEMGGNIEGLPGGLCLTGDNQSMEFAKQYCGSEDNIVRIESSWLRVGHVDEIVKVIPSNRPGVPPECNFSLMFASPKKALELMGEPRVANHTFFSGDFLSEGASEEELRNFRTSRQQSRPGARLCSLYNSLPATSPGTPGGTPGKGNSTPSKANKAFYKIKSMILPHAYAQATTSCNLDVMTNSQLKSAIEQNAELMAFNESVQNAMDRAKQKILDKIYSKLPHCRQYESIIEAPNLFYGNVATKPDGSYDTSRMLTNAAGSSFVPNPTNSVVANKDILFPDPQNESFRSYLQGELKKGGIGAKFLDTWDYAHIGDGNIHCSSHSIPYCSPASGASK